MTKKTPSSYNEVPYVISGTRHSILGSISSLYNDFTKSEKRIADHLVDHPGMFVNSNLRSIAEILDLGEATIIRFCRNLGFKGFTDFKMALIVEYMAVSNNQNKETDTLVQANIEEDDLPEQVALKLQKLVHMIIGYTVNQLNYNELEKVVDHMVRASHIVILGIGSSSLVAESASHRFQRIGIFTEAIGNRNSMFIRCSQLTNRDMAIGISHSGETKDVCKAMGIARDCGAVTVAITHRQRSTITNHSDYVLINGSRKKTIQSDSIGSKTSQFFIMDLIYALIANKDKNRAMNIRNKYQMLIDSSDNFGKLNID